MVESETHVELEERPAEGAAPSQSPWWRPAISHSAAVVAGAAVAVAVIAATVGLSPRVKTLRVPVVRTVTVRVPANPPAAATQPASESAQEQAKPAKPAEEPPRISLPRIPLILPPVPTSVRATVKATPPARPHVRSGASDAASKPPTPRSPLIDGLLAADRGDVDLAIQLFKKASEAAPRDPVPYLKLKEMYERKMVTAEKLEDEERYRALAAAATESALAILQPAPVAAGQ